MLRGLRHMANAGSRAWSWWFAFAVLLRPALARAAPVLDEASALGADCPGDAALNARVAELAGEGGAAASRARVRVTRTARGFRTEVMVSGAETRPRVFETATCAAGIEAAALAIALGAEPPEPPAEPAEPAEPPRPSPAPARSPAVPIRPSPARASTAAPASPNSSPRAAVRVLIGLGFDATALPKVAPTAQVGVSLALRERYWLEALAFGALPQDATGNAGRAHFKLFGGTAHACYVAASGRFAAGPCLGLSAYFVSGEGLDVLEVRSGRQVYAGPSAGLFARWKLGPVIALRAALDGSIPLGARQFELNDSRLYAPGKVEFSGAIGSDFRF